MRAAYPKVTDFIERKRVHTFPRLLGICFLIEFHHVLISLCFTRRKPVTFTLTTHLFDYLFHMEQRSLRFFFYIETAWWILPLYYWEKTSIFWFKSILKHIAVCNYCSRVVERLCKIRLTVSRRRHHVPPLPAAWVRHHALIHTWMS